MDFNVAQADALYRPIVAQHAAFYFGLPAPTPIIMGQIMQESGFDTKAKSRTGASGLLQFMPSTSRWVGEVTTFGDPAPSDPAWAIRAGAWYDRFLYNRVVYSDDCARWGAALSSYNGGLGWHNKRKTAARNPLDFWASVRLVNPGISESNQRENQDYPQRIIFKHQKQFVRMGDRKICI